jgi:hypothetical protein
MNTDGTSCFPSVELLANETRLSKRSICTHLEKADQEGWIRRDSRLSSGQAWRRYHYTPITPEGGEPLSIPLYDKAVNVIHQLNQKGGEPLSEGGERHDKKVVNDVQSSISIEKPKSVSNIRFTLSELLLNLILERRSNFKKPNLQQWSKQIDLMLRIDARDPDEIERVIEWSQRNPFWQNNILSTKKLRGKYDTLALQMNSRKGGRINDTFSSKQYAGTPENEISDCWK